jgi:hypothetical protein
MRTMVALLSLMIAARVSVVQSQVDYYGRLGLTFATRLLRDDLLQQEIATRQNLAPTIALGASLPIAATYTAGIEGTLTSGGYYSEEEEVKTDLGTLRTGSVILNLAGPLGRRLGWRAGLGAIKYWPADQEGIFLDGGPIRFLAGAGVDYRSRLLTSWDFMASLRYDFHRFTTDELESRNFSGSQGVQRVSLSVGLARGRP